jgi:hypothetical protein
VDRPPGVHGIGVLLGRLETVKHPAQVFLVSREPGEVPAEKHVPFGDARHRFEKLWSLMARRAGDPGVLHHEILDHLPSLAGGEFPAARNLIGGRVSRLLVGRHAGVAFSPSVTSTEFNFDQTLQNSFHLLPGSTGFTGFTSSGLSSQSVQMSDNQISVSTLTHATLDNSMQGQGFVGSGGSIKGQSTLDVTFLVSQPLDVSFTYNYQTPFGIVGPHLLTISEVGGPVLIGLFGPQPNTASLDGTLSLAPGTYEISGGSALFWKPGIDNQESGDTNTLILSAAPAIPEPSAAFVFGTGLVVVATRLRRTK